MIPPEFTTWQAISMLIIGLSVGIVVGGLVINKLTEATP